MGVARLVAKGWIVFCLFAAAHAIHMHLAKPAFVPAINVSMLLFAAIRTSRQ